MFYGISVVFLMRFCGISVFFKPLLDGISVFLLQDSYIIINFAGRYSMI